MEKNYNPEKFHMQLCKTHKPLLSFNENRNYKQWRTEVKDKFTQIIRMPEKLIDPKPDIEYVIEGEKFKEIRFSFESEPGYNVPCHLLIPNGIKTPVPVIVCVAGHSSGMHVYLGRPKYPDDGTAEELRANGLDRAIRTVENGYAALLLEQRAFGECEGFKDHQVYGRCHQTAFQAALLGRTIIGERIFDISQAIDTLQYFSEIDITKIACSGGSGGGTATFYASCADERIAVSFPSCAFSPIKSSIFPLFHCQCNYIPDILKYFDMQDLTCLIAPRPLIIWGGKYDDIFPMDSAREAFETVKKIYTLAGAPEKCRLVEGECGHQFISEEAFAVFNEMIGWNKL